MDNKEMDLLLSFDLSTTVVGYSIFSLFRGDLVTCKYHKFDADELVDRGMELIGLIDDILAKCKSDGFGVTKFVIEERLKSFRQGGTNADAMLKTAQLNFACQIIMKTKGLETVEINVNAARSACFPGFHKVARARKDVKQKEVAFEFAVKELGESFFPKKVLKSGPRKGEEVFLEEAKDMSDSWILGKAYLKLYDGK